VIDKFESILEFSKLRQECVFCKTPLRVHLTNFIGFTETGMALIKAPLKDGKFEFKIEHTTPSFTINSDVFIEANKNVLIFSNFTNGELPSIDEHLVKQTFEDYRPHVELYCPSKKCGLNYHLWSQLIKLKKVHPVAGMWSVEPFGLILEGARVKNYVVHNDWLKNKTYIYSRNNEEAKPIQSTLVDFTTLDKEKLITRIQTIVTFS
jgi:hypothetical protein